MADYLLQFTRLYDLLGRLVSQPGKGLCVVKTIYTDGTTSTVKRVMK